MDDTQLSFSVSEAVAYINQTLEYAYPTIVVEGEVSSFKVNQNKYVFFDVKDQSSTLGCFMSVFQLRTQLEDGMKVRVIAQPKLTPWGKFSLTVREVQPVGAGSIKKAFELLLAKLEKEGLFDESRKRSLPVMPKRIGVVSSTAAAGYADFIKLISDRWGGFEIVVAHTQVQGLDAPQQIIRALEHLNTMSTPPDVIAVLRGGGSMDDLSAFNDEPLARAVASSRVPVVSGIGHETDTTIIDLVADVRASTPSNAAQLLVPDKEHIKHQLNGYQQSLATSMSRFVVQLDDRLDSERTALHRKVDEYQLALQQRLNVSAKMLGYLDPRAVLKRGYSLLFDPNGAVIGQSKVKKGDTIRIETEKYNIAAGVMDVTKKSAR